MVHHHFHHKRQGPHGPRDNPFQGIADGINSLVNGAEDLFGGGGPRAGQDHGGHGGGRATQPSGKDILDHLEIRQADDDSDDNDNDNGANVVNHAPSTVYVTASWTGTGAFSLSTVAPDPEPTPDPTTSKAPVSVPTTQDATTTLRTTKHKTTSPVSATAAATTAAVSSLSSILSLDSSSTDGTTGVAAATSPGTSASAAASTASADTGGLSGGAKAGIAIGVILAILALAAGAFALYRMKKSRDDAAYENANSSEKNPFTDNAASDRLPAMPVAQTAYAQPSQPANPFVDGPAMHPTEATSSMAGNPTGHGMTGPSTALVAGAAGAVVGAAAANARSNNGPAPLNLGNNSNRAQSPALIPPPPIASSPHGSSFTTDSRENVAGVLPAAGGANAGTGGPRMHRVQMAFNPTMEDELQIREGEVVRIVRDFDDGWCTVEVVDRDRQTGAITRHQQGVVPRTCLSRLPLKPRQRKDGPGGPAAQRKNGPPIMAANNGRTQSPALVPIPASRSESPRPSRNPQENSSNPDQRGPIKSGSDTSPLAKVTAQDLSPLDQTAQVSPIEVELPIQAQSPGAPALAPLANIGHVRTGSAPISVAPGHARTGSVGSSASAPLARKPVPRKIA